MDHTTKLIKDKSIKWCYFLSTIMILIIVIGITIIGGSREGCIRLVGWPLFEIIIHGISMIDMAGIGD